MTKKDYKAFANVLAMYDGENINKGILIKQLEQIFRADNILFDSA